MAITKKKFGSAPGGDEVWLYQLDNNEGMRVEILSYGAIIKSIQLINDAGSKRKLVLGYDNLQSYLNDTAYLGATIGRYCNRIANACLPLDGEMVGVVANEGVNQLHGGLQGFNQRVWSLKRLEDSPQPTLVFEYISPAGEQGFPGNLRTTVGYRLLEDNMLCIEFSAQTDAATVVNLSNHSYFNLHGDCTISVLDHLVEVNADSYLPIDDSFLPTGEIQSVKNTPFDLRKSVAIDAAMQAANDQIRLASGFDHNWVLNNHTGELREVAKAKSLLSGIELKLSTTQPGLQFYTGNHLHAAGFRNMRRFVLRHSIFPMRRIKQIFRRRC